MSRTKTVLQVLSEQLRDDLRHADRHLAELVSLPTADSPVNRYAAAFLLQQLYGAIEAMLERSMKVFDGALAEGDDWHVRLVTDAAKAVPGLRPAILPIDDVVDGLRRFRHRVRKRYDDEIDPELVAAAVSEACAGWPRIREHLVAFIAFVDECAAQAE